MNSVKKYFLLIILLAFFSFGFLFYKEGIIPVNSNDKTTKIFVVRRGENLRSVIRNLYDQKLIRSRIAFFIVVKQLGIEKKIQAGDFRLSPSMDAFKIAETLTHGTLDVWVTVVEGLRKEQIAHLIAKELDIPEVEFIKAAKEGYLFPDTYLFPKNTDVETIIRIFYENFQRKFNQQLAEQAKRNLNLTQEQVLILASLVEREAKYDADRKKVASILIKRLKNDWPLQVDATVQYALGYQPKEKTWWKKNLTAADLKIDSPYNTYKNPGLPPTPICNPGLSSIKAVVDADPNTQYWYYLSDKTGKMHYAKTLEEHNRNIEKYLQ
jgi:UPF0755 protein